MGNDTILPQAIPPSKTAIGRGAPGPSGIGGGKRPRPPGSETIGKAQTRADAQKQNAGPKPGVPTPPDAVKAASDAVKLAGSAAQRTRKRLAGGTAGRVVLPSPSASQQGIVATSTPRTLIGG